MKTFTADRLRLTLDDKGIKEIAFLKEGSWHDIQPPEIFRIVASEARISNVKRVEHLPLKEKIKIAKRVREKIGPVMILPVGEIMLLDDLRCVQGSALIKEIVRRRKKEEAEPMWTLVVEEVERSVPYLLCKEEGEWRRYQSSV